MIRALIYLLTLGSLGREAMNRRGEAARRLRAMPPPQAARVLTWMIAVAELFLFFIIFPRVPFFRSPLGLVAALGLSYWGHRALVRTVARRLGPGAPPSRVVPAGAASDDNPAKASPKIINVFANRDLRKPKGGDTRANAGGASSAGAGPVGEGQARPPFLSGGLGSAARVREIYRRWAHGASPLGYYAGLAALYLAAVVLFLLVYRWIAG